MIRILKPGASEAEKFEADRKVRQTVEAILDDIAARGDVAVRELSQKFDKWGPESFRLTDAEILDLIATLPGQVIEDIRFAQAQIRKFAEAQKEGTLLPSNHSPLFAPDVEPALRTGIAAELAVLRNLLNQK